MYNKIASLILNSGKAAGLSDVYVAQPDALKENLAGKIFILAEIGGRKNDGRKLWDFLLANLNDNYYNDEKIMLRGKIEGLKIENIFEAALAKTNQSLAEFILKEKIKINPLTTNITLGVIYENKLHFASFGKNRSLLIHKRGEGYETINVEANAETTPAAKIPADTTGLKVPKLFSSIISGEIPAYSYFIFASEALPEYLSPKELMAIVTKLPPIVAAEQIKNILAKINAYVPFLGVIIKNTASLALPEVREEAALVSAASSISSLNYTEQKTERMLSPAGLINLAKLFKNLKKRFRKEPRPLVKEAKQRFGGEEKTASVSSPLVSPELGRVKSLNLARADSFLIKEKIFFKKKRLPWGHWLKKKLVAFLYFFHSGFWRGLGSRLKIGLLNLSRKNRWLLAALTVIVLVFVFSLLITHWRQQSQARQTAFNDLISQIETKENLIDSHLLYNDLNGARLVLIDVQALLASLPHKKGEQLVIYNNLNDKLKTQAGKVEKLVSLDSAGEFADVSGLSLNNLVFAVGRLYANNNHNVYEISANEAAATVGQEWTLASSTALTHPLFDGKNSLYFWDKDQVAQLDLKTGQASELEITGGLDTAAAVSSFKIFNNNLYLLAKGRNQIYRLNRSGNAYGPKTEWLKEAVDFTGATDLAIDGNIYVLLADGQVLKFYKGQMLDYAANALVPVMTEADKIIAGDKYLYVFEAGSKRLAVLDKADGSLANQYVVSSLSQPRDVAVDETGKAAYFLDGEAVYKISLNQ